MLQINGRARLPDVGRQRASAQMVLLLRVTTSILCITTAIEGIPPVEQEPTPSFCHKRLKLDTFTTWQRRLGTVSAGRPRSNDVQGTLLLPNLFAVFFSGMLWSHHKLRDLRTT